jgi:hypothetical protein
MSKQNLGLRHILDGGMIEVLWQICRVNFLYKLSFFPTIPNNKKSLPILLLEGLIVALAGQFSNRFVNDLRLLAQLAI